VLGRPREASVSRLLEARLEADIAEDGCDADRQRRDRDQRDGEARA
jgi:hypothetical protein